MYCPNCGSEERQLGQFCRGCGTDLRIVRASLARPDFLTASTVSAHEQISLAIAEKIRQMESSDDLKGTIEVVLPQIDKFLESPHERRLRRVRAGVITASIGFASLIMAGMFMLADTDFAPLIAPALIVFMVGLGIIINGLAFTVPPSQRSALTEALSHDALDSTKREGHGRLSAQKIMTNELDATPGSVTEHTTYQLKSDNR
jgi:hypothetical protein